MTHIYNCLIFMIIHIYINNVNKHDSPIKKIHLPPPFPLKLECLIRTSLSLFHIYVVGYTDLFNMFKPRSLKGYCDKGGGGPRVRLFCVPPKLQIILTWQKYVNFYYIHVFHWKQTFLQKKYPKIISVPILYIKHLDW